DFCRLRAFSALLYDVLHTLTLGQRFETSSADLGEVREEIFAAFFRRDESEALCVVEPLDGTNSHCFDSLKVEMKPFAARTPRGKPTIKKRRPGKTWTRRCDEPQRARESRRVSATQREPGERYSAPQRMSNDLFLVA